MMTSTTPRPVVGMFSILSPDPRRLAGFWSELMQLPISDGATDDLFMLDFDHEVTSMTWIFQRDDDVARGTAPIGLDISSEEEDTWTQVADRAEELGAERGEQRDYDGVRWIELRDPDGNRFRVFAPRPE